MYLPKSTEETRLDVLQDLIKTHPFACLVTMGKDGLIVNHMPLLIDTNSGEFGVLRGHVARANPVWRDFSETLESIAVFHGPESYISPTWYPSKHEHGKAVPTWNYAVVHAHGFPRVIEDAPWLLNHVSELSNIHESSRALPWEVSDAPEDYIDRMLEMIVGVEIPIAKLVGKFKLGQAKPRADQLGVIAGLESRGDDRSLAMADLMMQNLSSK